MLARSTFAARELAAARGYVIDFGKFSGKSVGELPDWYLRWLATGCNHASFNLRKAARIVLNERDKA
jgi:hypothetical protein